MPKLGTLDFQPYNYDTIELVAEPVGDFMKKQKLDDVFVAEIDPELSDTAAFCENYQIPLERAANCVIVEAKRADRVWHGVCVVLATDRADINGVVRKTLNARKISFAPMESATKLSGMEYGAITPVGLPEDWPILVDPAVEMSKTIVIGSGKRNSKLLVSGALLNQLQNVKVLDIKKT